MKHRKIYYQYWFFHPPPHSPPHTRLYFSWFARGKAKKRSTCCLLFLLPWVDFFRTRLLEIGMCWGAEAQRTTANHHQQQYGQGQQRAGSRVEAAGATVTAAQAMAESPLNMALALGNVGIYFCININICNLTLLWFHIVFFFKLSF